MAADAVNVGGGDPGLAGVLGVGVAEGDVAAGDLLVLKDVATDVLDGEVGADGELADAVAVLVRRGVEAKLVQQIRVGAGEMGDAVAYDVDGQRVRFQV